MLMYKNRTPPHFQKNYRWQDLKLLIDRGEFVLDSGIKYPKI